MAGALAGLVTLAPSTLPFVIIPLLITGILLRLLLRPTVIRQRAALLAGEEVAEATARAVSGVRDVTACGAEERVLADLADTIARQASAARSAARISAARVLCLAAGGWLPLLLVLAAAPSMLGHGASAGDIVGVITYITVSMRVALYTAGQAMGFGVVRLRVALDRIRQTAHAPQLTTDAPQLTADTPQLTADTPQLTPPFTDISEISGISWAGSPRETGNRTGNARGTANRTGNVKGTGSQTGNARGTANQTGNIKGTGSQARRFRESGRLASAGEIELRDVRFRYGPHAAPVIDGLSLRIPPGDHLAIAGPSGIGKSSLASLVAGTLRPCSGEVLLGGVAVTSCGRDWRVLIPQEAYVFTGTLRENLAYYRQEGDLPEKAELETAAEEVGLIPLLSRLGGYGADVSPAALSAGERQLIALTRAYLSPSPVAILDEATCHLDPAAEQRAEEAFARRGGTLIVIAHRITSARRARRILVLDGTRAQAGGHDELLAASPMYRDLAGHWASVPH
ncbi:MAG: ATP-binding cassette domain-containing protein [Nocardiopsaceae bacterium]|nr:ATP-binding cassette domain-containing protein [Nocardiopsaceae bacterium]